MRGRLMVACGLVALAFAVAPVRAQAPKFDELVDLLQKCRVDGLKTMIFNNQQLDLVSMRDAAGTPILVKGSETDCSEGVKQLIFNGADITDHDAKGRTALHAAAQFSSLSMVQLLVERKADVNAKTIDGETPLSLAKLNNYKGKTEQRDKIVEYLTKKGAKDKQ